jgi:uncharacterized protein YegP (UPF0339 family)
MRFEIYESIDYGIGHSHRWMWYWRLRAGNGKTIADGSEAYASRRNVIRAINRLASAFIKTGHRPPIVEVDS